MAKKWQYAAILDAGSSGTRIYVYKWLRYDNAVSIASPKELNALPEIEVIKKAIKKTKPGISTYADKASLVGKEHLQPLFDHALKHIPKKYQSETPLFLLATAGMRLVTESQRLNIIDEVCEYAKSHSPFQLPECDLHVQVIPGEVEGMYGWIAANYLVGGYNEPQEHQHGDGHHTYGFLDMGGASAQIAFVPNTTEIAKHAEDLKLVRLRKLNGEADEYKLFTTTWLGFGANQARQRYVSALIESTHNEVRELPDPCLPSDLKVTTEGKEITPETAQGQYLLGTGDFTQCLKQTFPLLEKDKPCKDEPCLLGGIHVPSIDFNVNHFIGVSEYWHTTHQVFQMFHDNEAYDFETYQKRVNDFCSQPWAEIQKGVAAHKWGKKVDEIVSEEVCFKASWLINMLHDGIGVPRVGIEKSHQSTTNVTEELVESAKKKGFLDAFQAVDDIKKTEVSWTLGKVVLYASSLIPPSSEKLPVGFGSNIPGIAVPQDFQRPGSIDATSQSSYSQADKEWQQLLFSDSPRRVPGLLLFGLIICVAVYFLCGRERRKALFQKCCLFCGSGRFSRRKGGPNKFFGNGPSYERVNNGVLEPDSFEIVDYEMDEDLHDVEAQSSGWASPKRQGLGHGDLVRADSRDHLGALRLEARLHRSKSPAIKQI